MPGFPPALMHFPEEDAGAAFDLATATQTGTRSTIAPGSTISPTKTTFSGDGLQIFAANNDSVIRGFTLSTPFVTPGGTLSSNANVTPSLAGTILDFWINTTGDRLVLNLSGASLRTYTMSPFDLTSISYTGETIAAPAGQVAFSQDGLVMFALVSSTIQKWTMSAPFALSTLTNTGDTFATGLGGLGIEISTDGESVYCTDNSGDAVAEFRMSTPYLPSTCVLYDTFSVGLPVVGAVPISVSFSPDQTHMLVAAHNTVPNGSGSVNTFSGSTH